MNDIIYDNNLIKKNKRNNKSRIIYFSVMGLFLLIGLSYALVFYMEKYESENLGLQTDLLNVDITEDGKVGLENVLTQKDSEGINNDKSTFTIANNNDVPIRVIIKLVEDHNSTLDINAVRFGILTNDDSIISVGNLGENNGVLYDFIMEPRKNITLKSTLWLDYFYNGGTISEVFSAKYVVEASNANQFAYMYLSNLVNRDKGLYAVNEDGTLNNGTSPIKEYRYSGLNVDNYIYFNEELWRIIGIVDGMVKIVKNDVISLNDYVDNDYYYNNLNETYKEFVEKFSFKTGSINLNDTYTSLLNNESSSTIDGYLNYISASDYLYSTNPSYYTNELNDINVSSNTWLTGTYLTLNKIIGGNDVLGINANVPTAVQDTTTYNIRPCLYLKKTVLIVDGNGTVEKPYVLSYDN